MKTAEEIKIGMECCEKYVNGAPEEECCHVCNYIYNCEELKLDAIAYIRKLESRVPRWISVEERLPEDGELVVFIPTINQGSVYVGKLSHTGARGGVLFENRQGRTTMKYYAKYWMQLPEAPEVTKP